MKLSAWSDDNGRTHPGPPQWDCAYPARLRNRVIQFGAHPNEKSISGSMKLDIAEAETKLLQIYLQGDGHQLDHSIHTANQVGILVLKIFEKIHPARFVAIGAAKALMSWRMGYRANGVPSIRVCGKSACSSFLPLGFA